MKIIWIVYQITVGKQHKGKADTSTETPPLTPALKPQKKEDEEANTCVKPSAHN